MLVHPSVFAAFEAKEQESDSNEAAHNVTTGISFDDLDLEDIVDPFLLSPRLPYPASTPSLTPPTRSRRARQTHAKHGMHIRSRSLGSVLASWPTSPPHTELPPVPPSQLAAPEEPLVQSLPGPQQPHLHHQEKRMSLLSVNIEIQHDMARTGVSPSSFLSTTDSNTDSSFSAPSEEDDSSTAFHTAPVSPVSLCDPKKECVATNHASPHRPYKHMRQSSSTSTIRMRLVKPLFRRGGSGETDISSDSDEEGEALPTPTDTLPSKIRHKRGSSFFKIIDRLKYTPDSRS